MYSANSRSPLHATVTAVEYLGAEALVTCSFGNRSIQARTRGDGAPAIGATVSLAWDATASHVFDAASGERLAVGAGTQAPEFQTVTNQGPIRA